MEFYVKISFISIFSLFFLVFKHDFIRCVDFTHIAASNTASDDVTYSCAHFVIETDEKCSHNGGFYYDLMTISNSGLLFWATLYITSVINRLGVRSSLQALASLCGR